MANKPILFGTPMVQAIQEDRKTQTRRIIKPQPAVFVTADQGTAKLPYKLTNKKPSKNESVWVEDDGTKYEPIEPKYNKGDILWVRETFCTYENWDHWPASRLFDSVGFNYKADMDNDYIPRFFHRGRWRPSIHMPKVACRLFLECTGVRIERLRDISEEDAIAEGVEKIELKNFLTGFRDYLKKTDHSEIKTALCYAVHSFQSLWKSINGEKSWKANPWVWVYDFKKTERPANFLNKKP